MLSEDRVYDRAQDVCCCILVDILPVKDDRDTNAID